MTTRTPDTHPPVPLDLRTLCRATGIAEAADVSAAYAAALRLVEDVDHDCNPTYCAITELATALDADHERKEDTLLAALKTAPTSPEADLEDDTYGSVIATLQHASFLLGAAYVFVMMSALAAPGSGGER
jgi:hypothetical protein